ncbi:hypothetical protein ACFWZU_15530 [Frateuria sp. GZRR33]|uniref:hypothetical protein n=1 Tax=Frateuria sp. GZRR33 TaxID=3351535 RepID=UPI003EDBFF84
MASISFTSFHKPARVEAATTEGYADWQAIRIETSNCTIYLSREEAAQLAADLLDAIDSQKVAA